MTQEAMKAAGSSAFTIKDFANTLPLVIAEITGTQIAHDTFLGR